MLAEVAGSNPTTPKLLTQSIYLFCLISECSVSASVANICTALSNLIERKWFFMTTLSITLALCSACGSITQW